MTVIDNLRRRVGRSLLLACLPGCLMAMPAAMAEPRAPEQDRPTAAAIAPWQPQTGDDWLDAVLLDVNRYADDPRWREAFVDELVRYQSAPRELVEVALSAGAEPGGLYYACAIGQALGRPCRELLDAWRDDAGGGWAGVVKRVDPEHARSARARVRQGVAASYARWGRPLDASVG